MKPVRLQGFDSALSLCWLGDRLLVGDDDGVSVVHDGEATPFIKMRIRYGVSTLVPSRDGTLLATHEDKKGVIVDAAGKVLQRFTVPGEGLSSVAFAPDARHFVCFGDDEGGTGKLCAVGQDRALRQLVGRRYAQVAFVSNTHFVTTSTQDKVYLELHAVAGGEPVPLGKLPKVRALVADGDALYVGTDKGLARLDYSRPVPHAKRANVEPLYEGADVADAAAAGRGRLVLATSTGVIALEAGRTTRLADAPATRVAARGDAVAFLHERDGQSGDDDPVSEVFLLA